MNATLSVVIPAYNEESRLGPSLNRISEYLDRRSEDYEILVVDDGSTDGTRALAEEVARRHSRIRCIAQPKNLGKGAAVRVGMTLAKGDWILMTDADLSAPIEELERLEAHRGDADVVIASRRIAGAVVQVHEPVLRETISKAFNCVARWAILPGITDTQCGFKLWSRRAAKAAFSRASIDRCLFEVEALWLCRRHGLRIEQVPIRWSHDARSTIRLSSTGVRVGRDLLRIFLRRTLGFKTTM